MNETGPAARPGARDGLRTLLAPTSIAVIGASTTPTKISGRPVGLLKRAGFPGPLYPINAKAAEVQGFKAYPSVADVPGEIESAIVALPAAQVQDALEGAIAKGIRSLVIFSSGFAELGAEGLAMQERLRTRAAEAGVRILGPNCMGLFNQQAKVFSTFSSVFDNAWPRPGRLSMAAQSGAYAGYCYALADTLGLGFSQFITTGNEADVDVAECLSYLVEDPDTDVIMCSFEGCKRPEALELALARARELRKPVVAMKVGGTPVGALASAAHTGSNTGDDWVFDTVLRRHNVYRAQSIEEMLDVAYAAATVPLPKGNRTGVISISGGIGIMLADLCTQAGLELPPLPADAQAAIKQMVPFASGLNPVDPTGQMLNNMAIFEDMIRITQDSGHFDQLIVFLGDVARNPTYMDTMMTIMKKLRAEYAGLPMVLSTLPNAESTREMTAAGLPIYEYPSRAVRAAAALVRIAKGFARPIHAPPAVGAPLSGQMLERAGHPAQLAVLLGAAGIPFAADATPPHGSVALSVAVVRDPIHGPMLTMGLAGPPSTVYGDIARRMTPIAAAEAGDMLDELRAAPLLAAVERKSLCQALSDLSAFAHANRDTLARITVEPLHAHPEGVLATAGSIERL